MTEGTVHSINVSGGGVPKTPVAVAGVRTNGIDTDAQSDLRYHGGPDRAVSIYSLELIEALRTEGHSIAPGSIGENLTFSGLNWRQMKAGVQLQVGEVLLEITRATSPCHKIAGSFVGREFMRVSEKVHPGWSRFYTRVLREGTISVGDRVSIV